MGDHEARRKPGTRGYTAKWRSYTLIPTRIEIRRSDWLTRAVPPVSSVLARDLPSFQGLPKGTHSDSLV